MVRLPLSPKATATWRRTFHRMSGKACLRSRVHLCRLCDLNNRRWRTGSADQNTCPWCCGEWRKDPSSVWRTFFAALLQPMYLRLRDFNTENFIQPTLTSSNIESRRGRVLLALAWACVVSHSKAAIDQSESSGNPEVKRRHNFLIGILAFLLEPNDISKYYQNASQVMRGADLHDIMQ